MKSNTLLTLALVMTTLTYACVAGDIECETPDGSPGLWKYKPFSNELVCDPIEDDSADEAGADGEGCSYPVFEANNVLLSHSTCTTLGAWAASSDSVIGFVDEPCANPDRKYKCFAASELVELDLVADMECGWCPELGSPPGYEQTLHDVCWRHPSKWEPAKLDGAIPIFDGSGSPDCYQIPPPIGESEGWPLETNCPMGVTCLEDGSRGGCSCNCVDDLTAGPDGVSLHDIISVWWDVYPFMPALVEYDLPVEATCTGEPVTQVENGSGLYYRGSTMELDGFGDDNEPNGEDHHKPVWHLDPPLVTDNGVIVVGRVMMNAVATYPNELAHGMLYTMLEDGIYVDVCMAGSPCSWIGLQHGDLITELSHAGLSFVRNDTTHTFRFVVK